jgi:predicted transcriptional regulator
VEYASIMDDDPVALNRRILLLELDNSILRKENEIIKEGKLNLQNEIIELKNKLKTYEESANKTLNETEIKILLYLAKVVSFTVEEISSALEIKETSVVSNLLEMKKKNMVASGHLATEGDLWSIDLRGIEYLLENKLIAP